MAQLDGHHVIIGYGGLGKRLASELVDAGSTVLVVDLSAQTTRMTEMLFMLQHDALQPTLMGAVNFEMRRRSTRYCPTSATTSPCSTPSLLRATNCKNKPKIHVRFQSRHLGRLFADLAGHKGSAARHAQISGPFNPFDPAARGLINFAPDLREYRPRRFHHADGDDRGAPRPSQNRYSFDSRVSAFIRREGNSGSSGRVMEQAMPLLDSLRTILHSIQMLIRKSCGATPPAHRQPSLSFNCRPSRWKRSMPQLRFPFAADGLQSNVITSCPPPYMFATIAMSATPSKLVICRLPLSQRLPLPTEGGQTPQRLILAVQGHTTLGVANTPAAGRLALPNRGRNSRCSVC